MWCLGFNGSCSWFAACHQAWQSFLVLDGVASWQGLARSVWAFRSGVLGSVRHRKPTGKPMEWPFPWDRQERPRQLFWRTASCNGQVTKPMPGAGGVLGSVVGWMSWRGPVLTSVPPASGTGGAAPWPPSCLHSVLPCGAGVAANPEGLVLFREVRITLRNNHFPAHLLLCETEFMMYW